MARHPVMRSLRAARRAPTWRAAAGVGIDLGTTNSVVSVVQENTVAVVPDETGSPLMPSVVAFRSQTDYCVGHVPSGTPAQDVVANVKRVIGQPFDEVNRDSPNPLPGPSSSRSSGRTVCPAVACDAAGQLVLRCPALNGEHTNPEAISALILQALKQRAERHLQAAVDHAVITVPARFTVAQRLATMEASTAAGLIGGSSLLQEPVAAALATRFFAATEATASGGQVAQSKPGGGCSAGALPAALVNAVATLVVDVGGGTADVSLLQGCEGMLEVVGTDGDDGLGGVDMDVLLAQELLRRARMELDWEALGVDDVAQLMCIAERAKRELSVYNHVAVQLPAGICANAASPPSTPAVQNAEAAVTHSGKALSVTLSRADARVALAPFFDRLSEPLKRIAEDYKLEMPGLKTLINAEVENGHAGAGGPVVDRFAPPPRRVTELVLVGGACKSPLVQEFLERVCGVQAMVGVDPELAVALGAGVYLGLMEGSLGIGPELTDSVYVKDLQGRISGFQM